jgi:hypothetical protein
MPSPSPRLSLSWLAASLATLATLPARAEETQALNKARPEFIKELKPTLMHGSANDLYAPALRYELGYRRTGADSAGDFSYLLQALSEGAIATDSRVNSENISAEVQAGGNLQTGTPGVAPRFESSRPAISQGGSMTFPENAAVREPSPNHNFDLAGAARFETDQGLDNYNATFGINVGYVQLNADTRKIWSLVPKVQFRFHYVEVLESREFERRGIDEDNFWRLDALADWTFKIGTWIDPEYDHWYSGLALTAALKYYRGFEMPDGAEQAGLDESWYYSGGVYYRFKPESNIARWISATYLTVGHGRIPPTVVDQTQVFLGVVLNFD